MAKVLLGATGSVAAIKTPELYSLLVEAGHDVKIVLTASAGYFIDEKALPHGIVVRDEDEWPGRSAGRKYQRDDPVLHIELRRWADLLLIAPLDANTLAKLANGMADNCLTCIWRAWNPNRPIVLAPAMNTLMWEHPFTVRHFYQLAKDFGLKRIKNTLDLETLLERINDCGSALTVVPPISKRLACGDVGPGAMAELSAIAAAVNKQLGLPSS